MRITTALRERLGAALAIAVGMAPLGAASLAGAEVSIDDQGISISNNGVMDRPVELAKQVYTAKQGPWGELEYYYTFLEAPDSLISVMNVPSEDSIWRFEDMTPKDAFDFFSNLQDLTEEQKAILLNENNWFQTETELRVYPTKDLVMSLTPQARAEIYAELRKWDVNTFLKDPIVIETGDVQGWFADTGLPEDLINLVSRLCYSRGDSLVFSDIPVVLSTVQTEKEERIFLKALTRTRTLVLRIRVSPDSNFQEVADYWTAGRRHTDILPILESVARTQGVERLDIAHLLPGTARKHLYTFPPVSAGLTGRYPDCFWTSLNFFAFWPSDRFGDPDAVDRYVRENYSPVEGVLQYGDMLLIADRESKRAFHSCIYLADDIVYTKNGSSVYRPWILMKLSDMMARYRLDRPIFVQAYRKNEE